MELLDLAAIGYILDNRPSSLSSEDHRHIEFGIRWLLDAMIGRHSGIVWNNHPTATPQQTARYFIFCRTTLEMVKNGDITDLNKPFMEISAEYIQSLALVNEGQSVLTVQIARVGQFFDALRMG